MCKPQASGHDQVRSVCWQQMQAEPLSRRMRVKIKRAAARGDAAAAVAKRANVDMLVSVLDWVGERPAALHPLRLALNRPGMSVVCDCIQEQVSGAPCDEGACRGRITFRADARPCFCSAPNSSKRNTTPHRTH